MFSFIHPSIIYPSSVHPSIHPSTQWVTDNRFTQVLALSQALLSLANITTQLFLACPAA
jgi:hypothetical protein